MGQLCASRRRSFLLSWSCCTTKASICLPSIWHNHSRSILHLSSHYLSVPGTVCVNVHVLHDVQRQSLQLWWHPVHVVCESQNCILCKADPCSCGWHLVLVISIQLTETANSGWNCAETYLLPFHWTIPLIALRFQLGTFPTLPPYDHLTPSFNKLDDNCHVVSVCPITLQLFW